MAQVLAREFECLTCHSPIKISKIDNPAPGQKKKWERFELDGVTTHQCNKQQKEAEQSATTVLDNGPQIAELVNQVRDLKKTVNILISQIQMLRSDVNKRKCISE